MECTIFSVVSTLPQFLELYLSDRTLKTLPGYVSAPSSSHQSLPLWPPTPVPVPYVRRRSWFFPLLCLRTDPGGASCLGSTVKLKSGDFDWTLKIGDLHILLFKYNKISDLMLYYPNHCLVGVLLYPLNNVIVIPWLCLPFLCLRP